MSKIREFRSEHSLTQQKVADIIGMPKRSLEAWEEGKRTPPEWVDRLVLKELERYIKEEGAD